MCIHIGKKKIYLNHFPYLCFEGGYHNDVWQLFGHVHTRPSNTGIDVGRLQHLYSTQLDVGVDIITSHHCLSMRFKIRFKGRLSGKTLKMANYEWRI